MGILDQFQAEQIQEPAQAPSPAQQDNSILGQFITQEEDFSDDNQFERGLSTGVDQLQMSLHGLGRMVGRELGIKPLEEYGNVGIERNQAEIQENLPDVQAFSEIDNMDDFFSWSASTFGQAIPSLAFAIGSGGLGGVIVKKGVENGIRNTMMNRITRNLVGKGYTEREAREAALRAMQSNAGLRMVQQNVVRGQTGAQRIGAAQTRGRMIGAVGGSAGPQAGEIDIELQEAGIDSGFTSILGGLAGGALEAIPALRLLDKFFPGVDREVSKKMVSDYVIGAGQQALLEGGTEAAQEAIQIAALAYHDPSFDVLTGENTTRLIDAFAAGALVGGLTGTAGEVTTAVRDQDVFGQIREKADRTVLPGFEFTQDDAPSDFEPADNTFFEELGTRIDKVVKPIVEPAMNTMRDSFQGAIDRADQALGGSLNREINKFKDTLVNAHNGAMEDHKAFVDDIKRYVREKKEMIAKKAENMQGPEREQFVREELDKMKAAVQRSADTLRARVQKVAERTSTFIDGQSVFDDTFEGAVTESDTRFVFGKNNTQDTDAVGYKTRKQARDRIAKLKEQFPSAPDSAFRIEVRDDGFVVAIDDSGIGQDLAADQTIIEAAEASRQSARRNPDESRHVSVQRTGVKGKTKLDVPTLVAAGKRLLGDGAASQQRALTEVAASLLDRGVIDGPSAQAIIDAAQKPETFKSKPKSRKDDVEEAKRTLEALTPNQRKAINEAIDAQLARETFKTQAQRTARRNELRVAALENIDRQVEEGAPLADEDAEIAGEDGVENATFPRDDEVSIDAPPPSTARPRNRPKNRKAKPRKPQKSKEKKPENRKVDRKVNSDDKTTVWLPGMKNQTVASAVKELTDRVANLLSDKTKVRVINVEGAQRMIDQNHPHASYAQAVLDHGSDFVHLRAPDGTTYILVDNFEDAGRSLNGLVHELGHAIHYDTWDSLNKNQQDELWKAFVADVRAGKRTTGRTINERDGKAKVELAQENIFEFREWMADQFVDWMNDRKKPQTALEKFLEAVAEKLESFWSFMRANPGRYGLLNSTYAEFADAVAMKLRTRDPSGNNRFYLNENAAGRPVHVLLDGQGTITPAGLTESQWIEVRDRLTQNYPVLAKRAKLISDWMHNAYHLALAPSTSVMRSISERVPAAKQLITIFNREEHGKAKLGPNYHQRMKLAKGQFLNRFDKITEGMTDAQKSDLLARLREMDRDKDAKPQSLRERQVRKLFDDMHDYMVEAGLPVGRIENYFPRTFSREKLIDNEAKIKTWWTQQYIKQAPRASQLEIDDEFKKWFNSIIDPEADLSAALANMQAAASDMEKPSFANMRSRRMTSKFMDQFLDDNIDGVMSNYIVAATKRAEFNRVLGAKAPPGVVGGDALAKKVWNPKDKFEQIMADAKEQGATPEDLKKMRNYVDANLGMYGRDDISDKTRTAMAAVVAYQNMRVLLFTVFASLPDMVGPAIRSGDLGVAFRTFRKNMKAAVQNDSDLAEMSRAWGVVSSAANQHVLTEYVDNHYMPPTLRKWNEGFFKWTGLNFYTDFTRKMALATGIDTIKNEARKVNDQTLTQKQRDRAKQFLGELGLTSDMVGSWVANGEPVFGSVGYESQSAVDEKIAEALIQFVDESIMSPNASQRPILASHPAAMLVYHLKGYIYAMHDIILKRLAHNFNIADTPAQVAATMAPAFLMIALTAIGLELRELITGDDRTGRMDGWDYTWEIAERSGLVGLAQLGFDFEGADARGQAELAALSGPAIGQLADLISKPASQTIPKAIPVVSQLPWARDALRESTPL